MDKNYNPKFYSYKILNNKIGGSKVAFDLLNRYFCLQCNNYLEYESNTCKKCGNIIQLENNSDLTLTGINNLIKYQYFNKYNEYPFVNENPQIYYLMKFILEIFPRLLIIEDKTNVSKKEKEIDISEIITIIKKYSSKSFFPPNEHLVKTCMNKLCELGFIRKNKEDNFVINFNNFEGDILLELATREAEKSEDLDLSGFRGQVYIPNATFNQIIGTLETLNKHENGLPEKELGKLRKYKSVDIHHEIHNLKYMKFIVEKDGAIKLSQYGKEFISKDYLERKKIFHEAAFKYVPIYKTLWIFIQEFRKEEFEKEIIIGLLDKLRPTPYSTKSLEAITNAIMSWLQFTKNIEYNKERKSYFFRKDSFIEEYLGS